MSSMWRWLVLTAFTLVQDPPAPPNKLPDVPFPPIPLHDCRDSLYYMRERTRAELGRVLIDRYMIPVDEWIRLKRWRTEFPVHDENLWTERWYLLMIRSDHGEDVWIKFSIDPKERLKHRQFCDEHFWECDYRSMEDFIDLKRSSLANALEHHLIQLLLDKDCVPTIKDGTSKLYRLVDRDTPVDKVRPDDSVW